MGGRQGCPGAWFSYCHCRGDIHVARPTEGRDDMNVAPTMNEPRFKPAPTRRQAGPDTGSDSPFPMYGASSRIHL